MRSFFHLKPLFFIYSIALISVVEAANRSHLYSFSLDKEGNISKIFDISEQNYAIPIIYKILVSNNTKVVPSHLFRNESALVGNAKEGRKRLEAFFSTLLEKKIYDTTELQALQEQFLTHLDKYMLDYFLFEPVEVIAMDDVDINQTVKNLRNEILEYKKMIDHFLNHTYPEEWSQLGIDFTTLAFYSLGDQKEVKKIEKAFQIKQRLLLEKNFAKSLLKLTLVQGTTQTSHTDPLLTMIAKWKLPYQQLSFELGYELGNTHIFTTKEHHTFETQFVTDALKLIIAMDKEKEALQRDTILDTLTTLQLSYDQQLEAAFQYHDLTKKLALYQKLLKYYPKEHENLHYWIADTYAKSKQYHLALEHALAHIISRNNPEDRLYQLESIIKKGKFNQETIYHTLSQKIKNKKLELTLIEIDLKHGRTQKAFDAYKRHKAFIDPVYTIWRFLRANQIEYAFQIIEEQQEYQVARYYFEQKKEFAKALYWYLKQCDIEECSQGCSIESILFSYSSEGEFAQEKINLEHLFESLYPKLQTFKPCTIQDITKELHTLGLEKIAKQCIIHYNNKKN